MKNRLLYILLLLGLCGQEVSAAGIDGPARREIGRTLTRIVAREVAGGYVRIEGVDASRKRVRIYTSVGLSYYPFREENLRAMRDSVRLLMPPEFRKADIELYSDKREVGELIPMACRTGAEYRKLLRKKKIVPFTNRSERPLVTRSSAPVVPSQGLAGRHIALWQSHGRYFDQPQNRWKWQRSQLWQTCEDLYTQSYVLPYLVPMLENAGACVMLPRERDVQKYEILADNDAAGQYREEEGPEKWQPGGMGFAHVQQVYTTGQNPFRDGTTRRVRSVTGGAESRAVWTADIPERGEYAVYVSYDSTPQNADDAQYTVHHLGGDSSFAVNQTMGGGTWIYLGRFLLDAGPQEVVTLTNRSRQAGRIVSADAVKIGGGYGNIARTVCDSLRRPGMVCHLETSGYPRFCEGARYWLQWAGFDEKVYSPKENRDDYKDDYMSRAHWVNALTGGSERMPDSAGLRIPVDMALAFHSDAGVRLNDDIIGTLGIFYTRENKGKFEGGADRYRSRDLTDIVMTQIVEDIRSTYEPAWSRRGLWNRAYYEARVPGVPTMLLELLSHQNFADMRYGSDPRFKFLVSRAVYKGILRYISSQYGLPYVVQPLPVESLAVQFAEGGKAAVTWSPVMDSLETTAAPTGYVVYTRIDGGVPDRQDISFIGAQHVFDMQMAKCEVDSIALGACACDYETEVIGGNTFDYPALHGRSVAGAGYSFCSASVRAVERGEVSPDGYSAVDLILGEQRSTTIGRGVTGYAFKTFSPELQAVLRRYMAGGGALFVSGSYVATDLWTGGEASDDDRRFAEEVLHYTYDGGRAAQRGRVRVVTSHPGFSRDEYRYVNEYRPDRYRVESPDALRPAGAGAFSVMRYVENGRTAGVASEAGGTFVMGFPFESIESDVQRDRLMRDVLDFLLKQKDR